jgi:hypothetical protein
MSETELQQDIQRVATVFMDRVAQFGEPEENAPRQPAQRQALLQRGLLYAASALDIATGPSPELNVLDMLVFTRLCRGALEQHWIPRALGQEGETLATAFALAEQETWDVAAKMLDPAQQDEVRESIAVWEAAHPQQFRVEGVRFQSFAEHLGAISSDHMQKTRGLLGQVRSATHSADQALLVSERAFFLVHRLPFLIRLQARLGVQETLSDSMTRLPDVEALIKRCTLYALLAGLGWALFFWTGYFVVKRR